MLEVLDPAAGAPAKSYVAALDLSDAALARIASGQNVRAFLDRLLADGLPGDALMVIARALPVQFIVAWCCECVRSSLDGTGPAVDADRAAVTLAEQCLKDPSDENRQLCLEFAERARRQTAGAWLVTAAAWADGALTPPGAAVTVPAPPAAVAEAAVAALKLASLRAGAEASARQSTYAGRALTLFGPRPARVS